MYILRIVFPHLIDEHWPGAEHMLVYIRIDIEIYIRPVRRMQAIHQYFPEGMARF
jgi:hypothetical protein